MSSTDLQNSEGAGPVLVESLQGQGAPQLHQTSETKNPDEENDPAPGSTCGSCLVLGPVPVPAGDAQQGGPGFLVVLQHVHVQRRSDLDNVHTARLEEARGTSGSEPESRTVSPLRADL